MENQSKYQIHSLFSAVLFHRNTTHSRKTVRLSLSAAIGELDGRQRDCTFPCFYVL